MNPQPHNPARTAVATIAMKPLLGKLLATLVCSCVFCAGLVAIMLASSGAEATSGGQTGQAAMLGAGSVLVGGLLGLAALFTLADGTVTKASMGVLACSMVRMLSSLAIGLSLWVVMQPLARPFWFSLLSASVIVLALETMISTSAIRAAAGRSEPA